MEDATVADLPAEVVALLPDALCFEMAETFCHRVYYPRFVAIETPDDDEFDFPGLSEPIMYLFGEDQGIMDLGIAISREGYPVFVSYDDDEDGRRVLLHAESLEEYIAACAFDRRVLGAPVVVLGQAPKLTDDLLGHLVSTLTRGPHTMAWPTETQYRFSGDGVQLLLWDWDEGQCDWHISGPDLDTVSRFVRSLHDAPIDYFYCHDMADEDLRAILRAGGEGSGQPSTV